MSRCRVCKLRKRQVPHSGFEPSTSCTQTCGVSARASVQSTTFHRYHSNRRRLTLNITQHNNMCELDLPETYAVPLCYSDQNTWVTFLLHIREELSSPAPTLRSWVRIPLSHGCLCVFCVRFFCFYIVSSETASRPNKRLMRTYHWISLFMSYIKSAN
jgi:hypothetical protein